MKKIIIFLVIMAMTLTMSVTTTAAETETNEETEHSVTLVDGEESEVYWQFLHDIGKLLIYGKGDMGDYTYDDYYRAYKLKQEDKIPWQDYKDMITSVEICEGITSIGDYGFSGLSKLVSVKISDTVESIGEGAFWECSGLESIVIPSSVKRIGEAAFRGCVCLKKVEFNEGLEVIESEAFNNCYNLSSVILPASIKSIASGYTFNNAENIKFKGDVLPCIGGVDIGTGTAGYYRLTKGDEQKIYILPTADGEALLNEIKKTEDYESTNWIFMTYDDSEIMKACRDVKLKISSKRLTKGIKVTVRDNSNILKEIKDKGYDVVYEYYRSMKKNSGYVLMKESDKSTYTNTKGKSGTRYYYKVKFKVVDPVGDMIYESDIADVSPAYRFFK